MVLVMSILLIRQSVQAQLVQETVQLGIDNLIEMNFEPLKGKRFVYLPIHPEGLLN